MYSARIVNDHAYYSLDKPNPSIDKLHATESIFPGLGGVLTAREADFDIAGRIAWVFISIKNRSFNRAYINQFIDMCEKVGIDGRVCAVDTPYLYNVMAEHGLDHLPEAEAAKIETLSTNFQRMVEKALRGKQSSRVTLVQWPELEAETPQIYKDELASAFHGGSRVRDLFYDHVSSVKPIEDERQFERFAEFFLCEVPVLMHAYYSFGPTMDIYTGPQPAFFWQIEMGEFAEELPELTALTRRCRPMMFLDTHNRRGVGK